MIFYACEKGNSGSNGEVYDELRVGGRGFCPVVKSGFGGFIRNNPEYILVLCSDVFDRGTENKELYDCLNTIMKFLPLAIERGHDMAVMQYTFYYVQKVNDRFRLDSKTMNGEDKNNIVNELIKWIERAYDLGFAPAAYMLAIIYRDGYYVINPDETKHKFYYSQFEKLRNSEERQAIIATNFLVYYGDEEERKQLCYSA